MLHDLVQILCAIVLIVVVVVVLLVWFDRGFAKEQEKDKERREAGSE